MSAGKTSPKPQEAQPGSANRPTPAELDARAEALKKEIDKHLGRGTGR
ncbi:hypothetical protein SBI_07314 [Streptomyces bingchenggensis BCW-1]|uniref:Sox C-terminal domain-containing protein n=1 Tax=Streptomyces bingchenggensis (strain BCW-1) TaxID=749414 RepID=D7C780_STRBB|nr:MULTISPECIES: hypothetical protein [Streptomyces]ADI10434.1 hypothetical protein SBI_07314 [Streptomyces bingchenggensis BCW-1]